MTLDKKTIVKRILIIGAVLVTLISIFTDFEVDGEYAIVTSYRLIQGDKMFLQMWEPHQTSHFICTFFMRIYLAVVGSTTGIVLYLNTVGVLLHGCVTFVLKKALDYYLEKEDVFYMILFFFCIRPKDILIPEFSNMQIWFATLLFSSLLFYYQNQKKKIWLLLASIFLCLQIISYPSCLLMYLPVVILLHFFSEKKGKDILLFTVFCMIQGMAYFALCAIRCGSVSMFLKSVQRILNSDVSHYVTLSEKTFSYLTEIVFAAGMWGVIGIATIIAVLIHAWVIKKRTVAEVYNKKELIIKYFFFICLLVDFIGTFLIRGENKYFYIYNYYLLMFLIIIIWKQFSKMEKLVMTVGMILGIGSLFSTILLTNLTFATSTKYMVLSIMVSLIALGKLETKKNSKLLLLLFCLVSIFRRGYEMRPLNVDLNSSTIANIGGVVRSGPAVGIFNNYMGTYIMNRSMVDFKQYVNNSDALLLVGEGVMSTLGYIYEDVEISAASTICTPSYGEFLLEYWDENPEKRPTVAAVDCWFGELHVNENSWIMKWIEEQEYTYSDGTYWRFYRFEQ